MESCCTVKPATQRSPAGHDEVFDRDEIVVPVFQKEPAGERTVCYCFAISEREIRTELIRTGRSSASER